VGVKIQLFEVGAYGLDFCLWGWMKSEVGSHSLSSQNSQQMLKKSSICVIADFRRNLLVYYAE
jgi:hypothetical protein